MRSMNEKHQHAMHSRSLFDRPTADVNIQSFILQIFIICCMAGTENEQSLSCWSWYPNCYFSFLMFYWNRVDLQCCLNFRSTANRFSYTHTHTHMYTYIYGVTKSWTWLSDWACTHTYNIPFYICPTSFLSIVDVYLGCSMSWQL